ncbi:MAG: hypothetical protein HRU71_12925 [Planctomycetia bacterium]|nr:MAG: hypothetical protein HRU71_12925 [Planctomycetia bacterium]
MKTFTDNQNRVWTLAVTVDAIKRVRALLGIDLMQVIEGKLIERLSLDPILLCDVVYAICKPEADGRSVNDEEFGRAMAGNAIEQASAALLEDLVDFFPSPIDRANLRQVLTATNEAMNKARDAIHARLESLDVDQVVAQALASAGSLSGNARESSASSPAASPSPS